MDLGQIIFKVLEQEALQTLASLDVLQEWLKTLVNDQVWYILDEAQIGAFDFGI